MHADRPTGRVSRAWSWVDHLRAGGSTAWTEWTGPQDSGLGSHETDPHLSGRVAVLPGAQHLEVLRRLNRRATELGTRLPDGLADRVLAAALTGRGLPDLPLSGGPEPAYGGRPVDPAGLPAGELLRVLLTIVADDLVGDHAAYRCPPPRRTRWRRQTYRLVGDPWLAGPARAALIADGRPPGGGDAPVFVLGTDLGTMITHAWAAGAFGPGIHPWHAFWRRLREEHRVARRADLLAAADSWAARVGPGRVRVVLDLAALPGHLGVDRVATAPVPTPEAAELARRVAAYVGMRVDRPRRTELIAGPFRSRLEELTPASARRLRMPAREADWVSDLARGMRDELARRDYPVIGDPELLIPSPAGGASDPPGPSITGILELATDLVLRRPDVE